MEIPDVSEFFIILQGDEFYPKRSSNGGKASTCAAFQNYMKVTSVPALLSCSSHCKPLY